MGIFTLFKKVPAPTPAGNIKVKRGFRLSKATSHTYEIELELTYKGNRLGLIPVNVHATSRANAKKRIKDHCELKVHKSKRKKET